jgi:hypothetical protein
MAEAFRCIGCRDFYSGSPALVLNAQGRTFTRNGEDMIKFDQHGGRLDYDPVKADAEGDVFSWPRGLVQDTTLQLCANCAVDHMLDPIHAVVHDKSENTDGGSEN